MTRSARKLIAMLTAMLVVGAFGLGRLGSHLLYAGPAPTPSSFHAAVDAGVTTTKTVEPVPAGQTIQTPTPPDRAVLASERLLDHSITSNGPMVGVEAKVRLINKLRDTKYLWRVQAIDVRTRKVVLDLPYQDQIFEVDQSGKMEPTFADMMPLAPGTYQVQVALYGQRKQGSFAKMLQQPDSPGVLIRFQGIVTTTP